MGAPKQKWTSEEEEALRAGVDKHGAGKWRTIQKDPEFGHCLSARSNIDLKDKWRNMSVSAGGQGSRERARGGQKTKATAHITQSKATAPAAQSTGSPKSAAPASLTKDAKPATVTDPSKKSQDGKAAPRYNMMIIQALSEVQDPNGLEISAICKFIEQRHQVPPNFRRFLSSKLRRLVAQDKIEKVQNLYKLKDPTFATKTPTPKQKDPPVHRSKLPPTKSEAPAVTIEEASMTAAYKIAEVEAKSFLASEAIKEFERISRLAEETDSMLQLAKEISEQCARGVILTVA
ncbi:hypothetical protein MRB53_012762 [Persea americana]|uniref:Uncharacterized protein n=1 Tax=Persea americana TaxID=3435 RepID=A0ACC2LYK9_PERAE|nr:hypothetical protein MRB53_012762 [Persea americana]|eukprot:TRINITY_DN1832_c0_g1_i3.p1 TRINITY_DN1832_c0_g1~~TRINITY_DN1832_c0_g1_i3.p1  ORF type:complete len:290 (+),score=69.65 TRINITY_DN1832_c0_g1_i3:210-1079(+)